MDIPLTQQFALLAFNAQDSDSMTVAKRAALRCIAAGSLLEQCLAQGAALSFPITPVNPELAGLKGTSSETTALDLLSQIPNLSTKQLKRIEQAIVNQLERDNLIEKVPSLMNCDLYIHESGCTYNEYRSEPQQYRIAAETLRAEVLEGEPLSDETIVLIWLLRESSVIHDFFSEKEIPQFQERMRQAYQATELGRLLMPCAIHNATESSLKRLLKFRDKFVSTDFGTGLNFLIPVVQRSQAVFIDVEGVEGAEARVRDIRNRLELLGHRWEMVREGHIPIVRIDNMLYECIPDGVVLPGRFRIPIYGVRLRRRPLFA